MEQLNQYNKRLNPRQSHPYPLEPNTGSPFDLSLLLVSKAIYLEAYPVFYKINTIYFRNIDIMLEFLTNIGPARRHCIANIGFNWEETKLTTAKAAFRLLQSCGNLKTLRLTIPRSTPIGYDDLCELRGLQNVIRLTKTVYNEYYGRKVMDWCTERDEDITQDEIDHEDDLDCSENRGPVFDELKRSLMLPRTNAQETALKADMEKVKALGGRRKK